MNKLWKAFGALAFLLFAIQVGLAWWFCSFSPRIEIFSLDQDTVTEQVEKTGCVYEAPDSSRLDVYSSRLFLAQELAARIDSSGSVVNDRSQAGVLARQAVEIVVFAAELWLFILSFAVLNRIIRKAGARWQEELGHQYPGEILEEYAVEAMVLAIEVVALLLLMALLLLRILGFSFYLPQSIMPESYILRFSQWFSHPAQSLPVITSYEKLCRSVLPALYWLGGACVLLGSMALGLGLRCLKKHSLTLEGRNN